MRTSNGFTLLELLVVLAICGILSAMAVPHVVKWLDNTRLRTTVMDLFADLQHARMMAARTSRNVILIFNTDKQGMLDNTYIIFVDNGRQRSTIWTHEPDETVLRSGSTLPGVHLVKVSFAGGVPKTRFNPMGFPNGFGGHIYMCNQHGKHMGIHVNINGRPRIVHSHSGEAGTWR